jgi:hypothetical protein
MYSAKGAVDLHPDSAKVLTQEIIAALAVEALATRDRRGRGRSLALPKSGHFGTELHDFTGKFMSRRQRKARPKIAFVNMQIGPTEAARVHPQQNIIGVYLRRLNIAVAELSRST